VTKSAKKIFLKGKLATEDTKSGVIKWVERLRPDATVDGTGIAVQKDVANLILPEAENALTEPSVEGDSVLAGVWKNIRTRPTLSFETASASASGGAKLKGLVPFTAEWTTELRALTGNASSILTPSPVVMATAEDPSAEVLGTLITAVTPLKEGAVYYNPENGLTVKGQVTEEQDKVIRTRSLGTLPAAKVTYALTPLTQTAAPMQEVMKTAEAVLPGGTSITGRRTTLRSYPR
jgi:hypothetical protein